MPAAAFEIDAFWMPWHRFHGSASFAFTFDTRGQWLPDRRRHNLRTWDMPQCVQLFDNLVGLSKQR